MNQPPRGRARGRGEPEHESQEIGAHPPAEAGGNGNGGNGEGLQAAGVGRATRRPPTGPGPVGNQPPKPTRGRPARGHRAENLDARVVTRPQDVDTTGQQGTPVDLRVNYFKLLTRPQWSLCQYHVDIEPRLGRNVKKKIIEEQAPWRESNYVFDGLIMYTLAKLPENQLEFTAAYRDGSVSVKAKLVKEVAPSEPAALHFVNVRFRNDLTRIGLVQLGRHMFSQAQTVPIPQHQLEIWPGYATSTSEYNAGLLLCVDLTAKVLNQRNVYDLMNDFYRQHQGEGMNVFREKCSEAIINKIVLTRYNNKTYRVDDIAWDMTVKNTFDKGGAQVSYLDYYQRQYNLQIKNLKQPLLVSKLRRVGPRQAGQVEGAEEGRFVHLVPELCLVTGLDDNMRSNFGLMKEIGNVTRLDPSERARRTKGLINQLYNDSNVVRFWKTWGLRFEDDLLALKGRLLPKEKVICQQNELQYDQVGSDWTNSLRNISMHTIAPCPKWLVLTANENINTAMELMNALSRACSQLGMQLPPPVKELLPNENSAAVAQKVQEAISKHPDAKLLMIVVGNRNVYSAFKKTCCIHSPIPSQVVLTRTLNNPKKLGGVSTKIAIQLNCKMGGEAWTVEIPLSGAMVVGVDTFHDPSAKGHSVAALVCSINKSMTRYSSHVKLQVATTEMQAALKTMFFDGLRSYQEANGALPQRVFFYRDGVSDGQLEYIKEFEIPQIRTAFAHFGQDYQPKFTFIVVKKRISTRILLGGGEGNGNGLTNPCPGTIVDDKITRPNWYDFYLVSQSVRQGTVSPTHYHVVEDSSQLKPDHIQRLSYKLTHLYYNWPGTVRVPAPCQYAHKLAQIVGQSLGAEPADVLHDKLWYL